MCLLVLLLIVIIFNYYDNPWAWILFFVVMGLLNSGKR